MFFVVSCFFFFKFLLKKNSENYIRISCSAFTLWMEIVSSLHRIHAHGHWRFLWMECSSRTLHVLLPFAFSLGAVASVKLLWLPKRRRRSSYVAWRQQHRTDGSTYIHQPRWLYIICIFIVINARIIKLYVYGTNQGVGIVV